MPPRAHPQGRRDARVAAAAVLAAPVLAAPVLVVAVLVAAAAGALSAQAADPAAAVARGAYLFDAAGCLGCHTDEKNKGARLAGGRALVTPFGTFYTPNITPDRATGIGGWSDGDFVRALREGLRPDGQPLYPAFPYTSYSGMTDQDMLDLKAYLFAQPAVAKPNRSHDLALPFAWRLPLLGWQWLYFEPGPLVNQPSRSPAWNRGRYLVEALGHCGECHTPRGWFGDLERSRAFAGNPALPGGDKAPNLGSDPKRGLGNWSDSDLLALLEFGLTPEGDIVGGSMAEVVRNTTGKLTVDDRKAIVAYLRSLPPVR
ncbi:MAG: c-type cytochrome [Azospirillum sp.]|nr:c-type cytochrome [Azospirillum sp.]